MGFGVARMSTLGSDSLTARLRASGLQDNPNDADASVSTTNSLLSWQPTPLRGSAVEPMTFDQRDSVVSKDDSVVSKDDSVRAADWLPATEKAIEMDEPARPSWMSFGAGIMSGVGIGWGLVVLSISATAPGAATAPVASINFTGSVRIDEIYRAALRNNVTSAPAVSTRAVARPKAKVNGFDRLDTAQARGGTRISDISPATHLPIPGRPTAAVFVEQGSSGERGDRATWQSGPEPGGLIRISHSREQPTAISSEELANGFSSTTLPIDVSALAAPVTDTPGNTPARFARLKVSSAQGSATDTLQNFAKPVGSSAVPPSDRADRQQLTSKSPPLPARRPRQFAALRLRKTLTRVRHAQRRARRYTASC